jgi:UDP-glucose 4-epimerase
MKKKILVTGGTGYIGSHTACELELAGYETVIVDNLSNSRESVLDGMAAIIGHRPRFYQVDVCEKNALSRVFDEEAARGSAIDGVIHFAAFKAVGESVKFPGKYYANNLGSLVSLIDVMGEKGVDHLVFSSSCTVYGSPDEVPINETAPIKEAGSPYGYTKQVCERIIEDATKAGVIHRAALLRYFNPVGAHSTAHIGELPIGLPSNLIPALTQSVASLRGPLKVHGTDYPTTDGSAIRDYIHVIDIAKAHIAAFDWLTALGNSSICRTFNLGKGEGYSVLEVISLFQKATGLHVPYVRSERRAGDVAEVFADSTRAREELGWVSELSLEDALEDAWRWQQRCDKNSGEL